MENSKEQLSQLELNIKALEKDGIKVKHMSGYHSKDGVIQLKDIDYKNGIVSFYHSSFDDEKDSDGDIIQKGSFAKTIRENFQRMKHLYNHDRTLAPGVVKEVAEPVAGCLGSAGCSRCSPGCTWPTTGGGSSGCCPAGRCCATKCQIGQR